MIYVPPPAAAAAVLEALEAGVDLPKVLTMDSIVIDAVQDDNIHACTLVLHTMYVYIYIYACMITYRHNTFVL